MSNEIAAISSSTQKLFHGTKIKMVEKFPRVKNKYLHQNLNLLIDVYD